MALDFLIARDRRAFESGTVTHSLSLEEPVHAKLFSEGAADLPLLRRIHDFYADAQFACAELRALCDDAIAVRAVAADDQLQDFLDRLVAVCERAAEGGLQLFVVCD